MVIQVPKPVFYGSFLASACAGAILLKDYLTNNKKKAEEQVLLAEGKVVIITGANTGIGKQTALQFAKMRAKVIMACRDIDKCEKARESIVLQTLNKHVYCRVCDLASQKSIREFSERFKKENDRLDILINNAAVMRCPYSKTKEGIEMQLGVNHIGHFLLTNLLLDRLKETAPSRVINLSGIMHHSGTINKEDFNSEKSYDEGAAYNQSKLAIVLFTKELARRLRGSGVTVNTVDPGLVEDTELTRHISFYNSNWAVVIKPFLWLVRKSPQQAADFIVHASLSPSLSKVTGKFLRDYEEGTVSRLGDDLRLAKWLWLTSEKWTGLSASSTSTTDKLDKVK